ncbi:MULTISPECIES: cupin domain-containing protein [Rahnella]|jgi:quercetin dioxygenase-like cupin family protein|uniref:Cupin n=1 Tax=Rahnella contaminans TaxID=2703882 RepID=A0A6M2B6Z4_9GAMM|nr:MULTISPECIES: cupin [Rahnella]KAB8307835.1 cupin [Rouxiella chamberiensis]MBU9821859.1 cupin [Rahnella sp. BCC 1045]MCS3424593.1 quercetin dioxygenase-like cupin family protein [Rahnella sp. BIGb0603]MDF1895352.1 cupin [Rahnella contaminans]NGX88381.1 cupin [Rahnella contaminans]
MTENEFRLLLVDNGFDEPVLVEREPLIRLEKHAHPFEAMAFILSGEITITTQNGFRTYCAGEIFHLQPNEMHEEEFGDQGVRYLSGRKSLQ